MTEHSDWIAATGLRAVEDDAQATAIPDAILSNRELPLVAKGIYALVLSYQGQPIDPYEDALEDPEAISAAVEDLIAYGLVTRLSR